MSETTSKQAVDGQKAPAKTPVEPRTFTQDEVNALVAQERRKEREKFGDYEDLKAKAAELDTQKDAAKSDLDRATERATRAEVQAAELLREAVAAQKGVPATHIVGDTREALEASAAALLQWRGTDERPPETGAAYVAGAGTGSAPAAGGSLEAGRARARARREKKS